MEIFNDLLCVKEKRGSVARLQYLYDGFRWALMDCNLQDIVPIGFFFLYLEKVEGQPRWVREWLDRWTTTLDWVNHYSTFVVTILISSILIMLQSFWSHLRSLKLGEGRSSDLRIIGFWKMVLST